MTNKDKEKRAYPRYIIDATSEIVIDQDTVKGTVKNISFSGFFAKGVDCSSDCVGKEVDIKIVTYLNPDSYCIEGKCRIIRHSDDGIGLFFIGMDNENISTLNKVILMLSMQESERSNKSSG